MIRKYIYLLSLILLASCSIVEDNEELSEIVDNSEEYTKLTMFTTPAEIVEDCSLTRIDVDWGASEINFPWAASDVVGIFPTSGSQLYFSMENGVGTNYVTFDGGGWALIRTADYYSYFPFVPEFYIDKDAIPLTFIGQEQNGNGDPSKAQLGNYCHQVAKGVYNETTNSLDFSYQRLGSLFRFRIPVDAGTYESLLVEVEGNLIAYEGTFKAINIDGKIHNAKYTDSIELTLKNVSFDGDGTLVAFMMLPPFDYLHKQITFTLTKSDGTIVKASGLGQNFLATKAYGYGPKYTVYAKDALIEGNGETAQVVITAQLNSTDRYSVSTDVDWLTLNSNPTMGSAVIEVSAKDVSETKRSGHVIVSRTQTYQGKTTTLIDKVEITQSPSASLTVGLEDWEKSDIDYGGVAQ